MRLLTCSDLGLNFSDGLNRAVFNIRKMPLEVSQEFLTDVSQLVVRNVVFENRKDLNQMQLYHVLEEYDLVVPAMNDHMTLFVAKSDSSCSEVVSFLRRSMSDEGFLEEPAYSDGITYRFGSRHMRRRFLSGEAKITTVDKFFGMFPCHCPRLHEVNWAMLEGRPSAFLTRFLSDTSVYKLDEEGNPIGTKVDHQPTVLHLLHLLGKSVSISENELRVAVSKRPNVDKRSCVSFLRGDYLPPLRHDGRAQQRFDWDLAGLYRAGFA